MLQRIRGVIQIHLISISAQKWTNHLHHFLPISSVVSHFFQINNCSLVISDHSTAFVQKSRNTIFPKTKLCFQVLSDAVQITSFSSSVCFCPPYAQASTAQQRDKRHKRGVWDRKNTGGKKKKEDESSEWTKADPCFLPPPRETEPKRTRAQEQSGRMLVGGLCAGYSVQCCCLRVCMWMSRRCARSL